MTNYRNYSMINVGQKPKTIRTAVAVGEIIVGSTAFEMIINDKLPKGNALRLAEIAGITGAKKTSDLIPLCHPLSIDHIKTRIDENQNRDGFMVYCTATATARTGVEMEALCGVTTALLTIYDLTKMVEPNLVIQNARLLLKVGGKSGVWLSPDGVPEKVLSEVFPKKHLANLSEVRCGVMTMSDRASRGEYEDQSGQLIQNALKNCGAENIFYKLVADDELEIISAVTSACEDARLQLLITTGGTGLAARDVTPDALLKLDAREIPGIGELLRSHSSRYTENAWSSRSLAVLLGRTIVVALPGSPKAVLQCLDALLPMIPHLIKMAAS